MPAPSRSLVFDVEIDARRQPHLSSLDGRSLRETLADLPPNTGHTITLTSKRRSKSAKQLHWYWGCILPALSELTGYTVEEMHAWCKAKFLNPPVHTTLVIVDAHGEVIEEAEVEGPETVSLLTTAQMADFCDEIRLFAASRLGVVIPDPDVLWKRQKIRVAA